jgi:hypothetical protein
MFFVNISEKENSIKLKFKKRPSLDDIKQTIWKRMQLERDTYNLMIADEVIMSDEHLVSVFNKEANQCHLNIIKHAALAHQAMPFTEEHEINPPLYIASDVLVYHPDEDVHHHEQIEAEVAKAQSKENVLAPQLFFHHDEDIQAQEAPLASEDVVHHHEDAQAQEKVVEAPVHQHQPILKASSLENEEKNNVLEQAVPKLNQAGMLSFFIQLWHWISSLFMKLIGKFEAEPTQSPSMSLR